MSLTSGKLQSWKQMASDVQPMLKAEEFIAAEQAVRNDPKAQEVLLKRGVPNLDWVMIEPWVILVFQNSDTFRALVIMVTRMKRVND